MIEDVLTTQTVAQLNALIDEHAAFKSNGALVSKASALAGSVRPDGRHTMSGMLSWAEPLSAPFRELLWHPKLVPVLQTVLGDGYRLDNGPLVMTNSPGGGGQRLHGAALSLPVSVSVSVSPCLCLCLSLSLSLPVSVSPCLCLSLSLSLPVSVPPCLSLSLSLSLLQSCY